MVGIFDEAEPLPTGCVLRIGFAAATVEEPSVGKALRRSSVQNCISIGSNMKCFPFGGTIRDETLLACYCGSLWHCERPEMIRPTFLPR
jgi:hypothetical protein